MVVIRPFKSIRPDVPYVKQVATHPYDVLNSTEAAVLAKDNPYSFLHIDKAEIDLSPDLSPYDEKVYQQAATTLADFLSKGWLVKEAEPALYLYELTMNGRAQTGLVTCTAIEDYVAGKIKKHEYTRYEKEIDRINHIDACDANTSPIFLTYRQEKDIQQVIETWQESHPPLYDFKHFYDVQHRVWLVDDPEIINQLVLAFQEVPALYIADGHHRTESAVKVGLKRRKQYPLANADSEFNYFLSVIFPHNQLAILDYNRVLNVPLPSNFFEQLETHFEISQIKENAYRPKKVGNFGMFDGKEWYNLKVKSEFIPTNVVAKLDASILQQYVFENIFDIEDIRSDQRIDFVGGIRGIKELEQLVQRGDFTLAFTLFPTEMEDLLAVADAGEVMPPKSTWFEPKLLSGLFLHDLESPN